MLLGDSPSTAASHATASDAGSTHSRNADPGSTKASAIAIGLVVLKENGVDHSIGALGRFDGLVQSLLASHVNPVRKQNDSLAALLLRHQLVRRQVARVVEQGPAAMMSSRAAGTTATRIST